MRTPTGNTYAAGLPGLLRVLAWAVVLSAALSIAQLPGNWGHSICGPWGCGPPLQALAACHLAWLVVLTPLSVLFARSDRVPAQVVRRSGTLLCIVGAMSLAAVVIYQQLHWRPSVGEWQSEHYWRRCGFVVATTIDVPMAQILLLGAYLVVVGRRQQTVSCPTEARAARC